MSFMKKPAVLALLLLGRLLDMPAAAHAGAIEDTWLLSQPPTQSDLDQWRKQPGQRTYRFTLEDPASFELESLLNLPNVERLDLQLSLLPNVDVQNALERLSQHYVGRFTLVSMEGNLPSASQGDLFDRLNRIHPTKMIFLITAPQDPDDAAALSQLHFPTQVNYVTRVFPRYADRPSWESIPAATPLVIASDYWPQYTAMDLLNLLKMPQRIRIRETFPPAEALPYVRNLKNLDEVTVDTSFDPSGSFRWEDLGNVTVRWSKRDTVPSPAAAADFCKLAPGQPRKLILDRDGGLLPDERKALEGCADRIPVEWIHAP